MVTFRSSSITNMSNLPLTLPELGARDCPLRISAWFVDEGDRVEAGDRIAEVVTPGISCDITATTGGRLVRIERPLDTIVHTGDVLAWVQPLTPSGPMGTDT